MKELGKTLAGVRMVFMAATALYLIGVCQLEKAASAQTAGASAISPPTIRVLGEDSSNLQAIEALYKSKPFAGAKIDFIKKSFEDALQKANIDFAQGTGLYDIVLQYNFSLSSFSRNRYVLTVDELKKLVPQGRFEEIEGDLFLNVWDEVGKYYKPGSHDGSHPEAIGYPFAANTMLLVMNRRMFADAANKKRFKALTGRDLAVPKTWNEFAELAKFFTSKDTHGVCLQGQQGGWLYYEWSNFLFGMGGRVMNKKFGWAGDQKTEIDVDSEAAVKAAEFYVGLRPYNGCDFTATGASEQKNDLLKGKTAMAIVWSDYLWGLIHDGSVEFDFAPIPGGKSMIAGGSFYISRKTKNPQATAQYVLDLLGKDNQAQLMLKGLCSPVKSAYEHPDVVAKVPYAAALRESLKRGEYMLEAGPDADAIQAVITEQMQRLWQGEGTARIRLDEAKKQIDKRRAVIWEAVNSGA